MPCMYSKCTFQVVSSFITTKERKSKSRVIRLSSPSPHSLLNVEVQLKAFRPTLDTRYLNQDGAPWSWCYILQGSKWHSVLVSAA